MTEHSYYHDSYTREFEATIAATIPPTGTELRTAVVLDKTFFYPTSGGQPFDTGSLILCDSEKRISVVQVEENDAGEILHFVDTAPATLALGTTIRGVIDSERRNHHMQQHSGQHILSAAFIRLFDMPALSFHLGAESCSIDIGVKSLAPDQVEAAERLANQVLSEDRPVSIRFASLAEAKTLGLRKLPDLGKSELRLIEFQDFDLTACGGTHVRSTGEIGCVLLRKVEKVKQGVRVEFVCGQRAVALARRDYAALAESAGLLSASVRRTRTRAMTSASATAALTPSSIWVWLNTVVFSLASDLVPTSRRCRTAEMIPIARNGLS